MWTRHKTNKIHLSICIHVSTDNDLQQQIVMKYDKNNNLHFTWSYQLCFNTFIQPNIHYNILDQWNLHFT